MELEFISKLNSSELGKELADARKAKGLTQSDVANLLSIARTTIVAIEKGERKLKPSELAHFAEIYGRSVKEFLRKDISFEPQTLQLRSHLFHSEIHKEEVDSLLIELKKLCKNFLELEEICKLRKVEKFTPIYSIKGIPIQDAAEEIAKKERIRFELGELPIPDFRNFLEDKTGIRIFYLPMSSQISGLYFYDKEIGGCMAINLNHPESKRRASLAHEYAHYLESRFSASVSIEETRKKIPDSEFFAEQFAFHFLIPSFALKSKYHEIKQNTGVFTPRDIVLLSNYFGTSFQAMTLRLESLKLVPVGLYERLKDKKIKPSEIEKELGIQKENKVENKFPRLYLRLAIQAYYDALISEGQFSKYLALDRMDARIFLEQNKELYEEPIYGIDLSEKKLEEIGM